MSSRRWIRRVGLTAFAFAVLCVAAATIAPVSGQTGDGGAVVLGGHVRPVDGPVIDPFRQPDDRWSAGNRGIEYDTEPGDSIRASADGVVIFAGQVGGDLFVTIRHSPSLVTTMAFVGEIRVSVGDAVSAGDVVALADGSMHFTARLNGIYIDPQLLFAHVSYRVRLIPTQPR